MFIPRFIFRPFRFPSEQLKMTSDFQVIPTPSDAILSILKDLNDSFLGGKTLPIEWRKTQLRSLWKLIDVSERYSSPLNQPNNRG